MEEINVRLKHYAALGAEGIVLKNLDSPWTSQSSATREWLKAKVYEDVEARVVRLYQGKDKEGKPRKGVVVELPSGVEQGVTFANDNLIAHDKLQPGMLMSCGLTTAAYWEPHESALPSLARVWRGCAGPKSHLKDARLQAHMASAVPMPHSQGLVNCRFDSMLWIRGVHIE
jgi:hypothetical protein